MNANNYSRATPEADARRKARQEQLRREARTVRIPKLTAEQAERRERGRNSLLEWIRTYRSQEYTLAFGADQLRVLARLDHVARNGGKERLAMPRSSGKTAFCEEAATWALLYGHRSFVVIAAKNATRASEILDAIKVRIETSDLLAEDFPEVCLPVAELERRSQRAAGQYAITEADDKPAFTRIEWKASRCVFPSVTGSVSSGAVLTCKSIKEIRGLRHVRADGTSIRPDFVLIDDPQDDEIAESDTSCAKIEKIITAAIGQLAGPKTQIGIVMACTVIREGDVAWRFLDHDRHPDWGGARMQALYTFPDAQETLWRDYAKLRREAQAAHKGGHDGTEHYDGAVETAFYLAHREEMDAGAVVAWPARFKPPCVSALQELENQICDDPAVFWSEFQNDPRGGDAQGFQLAANTVSEHTNGWQRREVPPACVYLTVGVDVNVAKGRGIHWVALASAANAEGCVIDYGRYPHDKGEPLWTPQSPVTEEQAIVAGLADVVTTLTRSLAFQRGQERVPPTLIMFDRGYRPEAVCRFVGSAPRQYGVRVAASRGFSNQHYRPTRAVGRPGDAWHVAEFPGYGHAVAHNSDLWRARAQRGFLLPVGAPGAISLWGDSAAVHETFGDHVAAEKLVDQYVRKGVEHYEWREAGPNDLLDALVIATVAASVCGAVYPGTEQERQRSEARKERARVVTATYTRM